MVTVGILGGLGNQLFQYAFGRCLSLKKNTDLILDYYQQIIRTDFDGENLTKITDVFDLPAKIYIGKTRKKIFSRPIFTYMDRLIRKAYLVNTLILKEKNYDFLKEKAKKCRNVYLIGYWQSEQYFGEIEDIVRNDFKFKIEQQAVNLDIYKEITSTNSVSLHVRKIDYKKFYFYKRCGVDYYLKAIDIISKADPKFKTFIFTDSIDNVEKNYKELLKFSTIVNVKSDFASDALDLLLMSRCKHNIIANSSFSWWGAWLNKNPNKIVIAPKKWFNDSEYSDERIVSLTWNKI